MRKLDKAIIWPIYFDAQKPEKKDAEYPKTMAVQSPKIDEIKEAADKLGLKNEINLEAHFPKTPGLRPACCLLRRKKPKKR